MIDQQTIDKVVDTAQIYDVVSEFVSLRRRGQNYVGLCPFHSDKNPSFYVSPTKNVCKCFSCNEGGGPVQFIMKHEQISFFEAIKWLGKKYGIEVEDKRMTDEEKARQTVRESMLMVNEFAQKTFEQDLYMSQEGQTIGLTYFRERGLQDETIKRFHLGYAIENRTDFASRALAKGYKRELLLDPTEKNKDGVGLCYGEDPRKTPTCRFHGRVIFPYHSISGKPIAFGGRILQRVDHAFKKYVNSPESALYHKSDLLYGIYQAKSEIAKLNKCYIVEGNVDVLTMSQAGFQNVVASAGTALTSSQIRLIKRFTDNVTLMYDGDNAGITAALKTIDLLLLEGMNVQLILFPNGDDPDSFCRKYTKEEISKYFEENERDIVSFKAHIMLQGNAKNDPIKKAQITQNIVQSIALISDPIISSVFIREASQILGVSEPAIIKAIQTTKQNNYAAEVRKFEIEQRRLIAKQDREERESDDKNASEKDLSSVSNAENDIEKFQEAQQETKSQSEKVLTNDRVSLPTDIYERNIIQCIVKYGGEVFNDVWQDENNQMHSDQWKVIDYIKYILQQDEIEFQHPLYAKMLKLAVDETADTDKIFSSTKFFFNYPDDDVRNCALSLESDRYNALGIVQEETNLDVLVPRCVQELQECLVRIEIDTLRKELKDPNVGDKAIEIMSRLNVFRNHLPPATANDNISVGGKRCTCA